MTELRTEVYDLYIKCYPNNQFKRHEMGRVSVRVFVRG